MLGAIAGDIIGSVYEVSNIRTTDFPLFIPQSRFTDDTVLSIALAHSLLNGEDFTFLLKWYFRQYPHAGYGGAFTHWAWSGSREPYNSWGNGSAMRVSPVGWAFNTIEDVLEQAKRSAEVTHNHPEGIRGAQAIAAAIFLARNNQSKQAIRAYIEDTFGYALDDTIDNLRATYKFDVSCQGSVPQAIIAFLESDGYEDCIRKAISIGGDSDTIACMAGGIAHAFYGAVPENIKREMYARLDEPLIEITFQFCEKFGCG